MKKYDKLELVVYALLWGILLLAPALSLYVRSTQDDRFTFQWDDLMLTWSHLAVYFIVFLIHNFLLAPLLINQHRRLLYFSLCSTLIAVFFIYQCSNRPPIDDLGTPPEMMNDGHRPPSHFDEIIDDAFFDEDRPPRPDGSFMDDEVFLGHERAGDTLTDDYEKRPMRGPADMGKKYGDRPPVFVGEHDIVKTLLLVLMLGMNLGVKLYFKQRRDEKTFVELERQKLEQQLEYLKYQINPHFLMNTLNNIHALVDIEPEEAKEMILELSKILRFVLYDGSKQKVPLERELTFMKNYIELMKKRYTDKVSITVTMPATIPNSEVPPLMFITFVENAFKHGVSYQQQSFVDIDVSISDDQLHFHCANSRISKPQASEQGGVGLRNVTQRLDLIYGNRYTLDISDQPDQYVVSLTLPLQ